MVPRYSRPEMAAIWSPEERFRIWFEIEALAAEAMARLGTIPEAAARAIGADYRPRDPDVLVSAWHWGVPHLPLESGDAWESVLRSSGRAPNWPDPGEGPGRSRGVRQRNARQGVRRPPASSGGSAGRPPR